MGFCAPTPTLCMHLFCSPVPFPETNEGEDLSEHNAGPALCRHYLVYSFPWLPEIGYIITPISHTGKRRVKWLAQGYPTRKQKKPNLNLDSLILEHILLSPTQCCRSHYTVCIWLYWVPSHKPHYQQALLRFPGNSPKWSPPTHILWAPLKVLL